MFSKKFFKLLLKLLVNYFYRNRIFNCFIINNVIRGEASLSTQSIRINMKYKNQITFLYNWGLMIKPTHCKMYAILLFNWIQWQTMDGRKYKLNNIIDF